jgi:hypothetical protein
MVISIFGNSFKTLIKLKNNAIKKPNMHDNFQNTIQEY